MDSVALVHILGYVLYMEDGVGITLCTHCIQYDEESVSRYPIYPGHPDIEHYYCDGCGDCLDPACHREAQLRGAYTNLPLYVGPESVFIRAPAYSFSYPEDGWHESGESGYMILCHDCYEHYPRITVLTVVTPIMSTPWPCEECGIMIEQRPPHISYQTGHLLFGPIGE